MSGLFFILGFVQAQDLVISGITSPSGANGTYVLTGTTQYEYPLDSGTYVTYNYWKHSSANYYLYNDSYGGVGYWNIDTDLDDNNDVEFYIESRNEKPPASGYLDSPEPGARGTGNPLITFFPEISVEGNGYIINSGDSSPRTADYTDFGSHDIDTGTRTRTFTIKNLGYASLTLSNSPRVELIGGNTSDFTVSTQPSRASVAAESSITFKITFNPTALGTRSTTVSIENSDSDETPYIFAIQGTGTGAPEISIQGNAIEIANGANAPDTEDNTDFGTCLINGGASTHTFTIKNLGNDQLNLGGSPVVAISGSQADEFTVISQPNASVAALGETTFSIMFSPTGSGIRTGTLSVINNDSNENPYTFAIQGTGEDPSLPVDISSFSAVCEGQTILLEWATESETDNLGFILERSVYGEDWITIASYQTNEDLKGQGNTSARTEYAFTDTEVEPGTDYEYRLSDVSTDGKITVYTSLPITLDALPEITAMEKAYPNPFNPSTFISYHLVEDSQVEISVYDMLGRKVQTLFTGQQQAGSYHVYWHGKNEAGSIAPTGTYLIRMQTENTSQVQKVLLMK